MRNTVFSLAISISVLTGLGQAQKITICPKVDNMNNYPFWLIQGKSGRLYSPLSFANNYSSITSVIPDLQNFNLALKNRKIQLVLAQVPQTSLIYSNDIDWNNSHLNNRYDPQGDMVDFTSSQKRIEDSGILVVDLLSALLNDKNNSFYLYDHHWTAAGAKKAALATAKILNKISILDDSDRVKIKIFESKTERVPGSYMAVVKDNCGDPGEAGLETVRLYDLDKPDSGLLDEKNPSIVVVGDSYATERFGFGQFLASATQSEVQNASISGGGQFDSIITYLISQRHITTPPKVIIWNFLGGLNDSTSIRVMTAAVAGKCQSPLAQGITDVKLMQPAKNFYLYARSKDSFSKELKINFIKNGVLSDSSYIKFSDRVKNDGQFYYTIPEGVTEVKLESSRIESLQICVMK